MWGARTEPQLGVAFGLANPRPGANLHGRLKSVGTRSSR